MAAWLSPEKVQGRQGNVHIRMIVESATDRASSMRVVGAVGAARGLACPFPPLLLRGEGNSKPGLPIVYRGICTPVRARVTAGERTNPAASKLQSLNLERPGH